MKRYLSIVIAILMLAVLTITASAAGVTATTETKSCAQGGTVTVNVSLSSSVTVTSGAVEVIYDKTKLQLVEGTWNTSGALLANFDTAKDKGAFAFATASAVNGKIFSVKFKVLSNAPVGDTEVKCIVQLKDASNNDISVTNTAGKVSVTCNHSFTEKTENYLASPASCISAAKYYYTCSICGEKGNTTFTVGTPGSHTYNRKVTTADYLVKPVDCVDSAEYYFSCECGAKGSEKFTGDASWTHSFGESWFISAAGHWHGCTDCGAKKDYATHSITDKVCTECFFVMENTEEHVHSYSTAFRTDDVGHWYECICGDKKDYALHGYDNGTVTKEPTESTKGEKTFICGTCYHSKVEELPMIEIEEDNNNNQNENNTTQPPVTEPVDNSSDVIVAVIITACSILGVEAVAFVIYKAAKKTKNSNSENASSESKPEEKTEPVEENNDK